MSAPDPTWTVAGRAIEEVTRAALAHGRIGMVVFDSSLEVHVHVEPSTVEEPGASFVADLQALFHYSQAVLIGEVPALTAAATGADVELIVPVLGIDNAIVALAHVWIAERSGVGMSVDEQVATMWRHLNSDIDDVGHATSRPRASQIWYEKLTTPISILGLAVTGLTIAIAVLAYVLLEGSSGGPSYPEPHAAIGVRTLPPAVAAGPADLILPGGSGKPTVDDRLAAPELIGTGIRQGCSSACTFNLDFKGSADPTTSDVALYVVKVFPSPEFTATLSAYGANADGSGSVVVQVPFAEGWVCYRMLQAVGASRDVGLQRQSQWSAATCYDIDQDGYLVATERRP